MSYLGLYLTGCNKYISQDNYNKNYRGKVKKKDLERQKYLKLSWLNDTYCSNKNDYTSQDTLFKKIRMTPIPISDKNLQDGQIITFTRNGKKKTGRLE